MEAALLVVMDNIDGRNRGTHVIHNEATGNVTAGVCSCPKVAARETVVVRARQHRSRRLPLDVVAVGEAHPEHDGPAHGTRVPRIRVRSVVRDIFPTAVLTCYYIVLLRCLR